MEEQIKELTLLLLYLNSWVEKEPYGEFRRSWKGYDFDILNALEDEHLIGGSTHKAKSTYLTEEGLEKAKKELQDREKQTKEKERESEKLKKKYQLELEKKEGKSIE